jgi:Protein of unknown function (DUF1329)
MMRQLCEKILTLIALLILGLARVAFAQSANSHSSALNPPNTASGSAGSIPAGTRITLANWRNYQQFMPDGMKALFQGQYFWKMPADVELDVGPTLIHPLPRSYTEATEKYAAQVRLIELSDGGLTIAGYRGGRPFPNPANPHRGWKILANVWYRPLLHLIVDTYGSGCYIDSFGSMSCNADEIVYRQLSFNTDPGVPAEIPGAAGKFYTEWVMTVEPEQQRYNATLTISYDDLSKPEDVYVFIPALRRYQPVSAASRCAQSGGSDATADDYRFGFDSSLTQVAVEDLGQRELLGLVDAELPPTSFPHGYDMPLGWPRPSWGKWQVRKMDVISVSKLPAYAKDYCYGKRVMYVDQAWSAPLWEDLYDADLKPWKFFGLFLHAVDLPGLGPVTTSGSQVEAYWDIQHKHATFFSDPAMNHPFYINQQAPPEYDDLTRYTTPSGLNEIMR